MKNTTLAALFLVAFCALAPAPLALAQTSTPPAAPQPVFFGSLTAKHLADDPRLVQQKIETVSSNIYIGELMRQWQEQTGIAFVAADDGKDLSGRWQVILRLRAVTVADAMDALRSALSEQGALWQWQRTGTAPTYRYRLVCPRAVSAHQDALERKAGARFERQLTITQQALRLSREELQQAADSDTTGTLRQMITNAKYGEAATVFASNISRQQRSALQRGGTMHLLIPSSELNAAGQRFAATNPHDQTNPAAPPALSITIEYPNSETLFPTFYVNHVAIGPTPELTQDFRGELSRGILLSGDSQKRSGATSTKALAPKTSGALDKEEASSVYHRAIPYDTNFIVCPPQLFRYRSEQVKGSTQDEVRDFFYQTSLPSKWRGDILLFHFVAGFVIKEDVSDVPPQALYDFVQAQEKEWQKERTIPLNDLLLAAKLGNHLHWRNLVSGDGTGAPSLLRSLTILHTTFVLMTTQPDDAQRELLSAKGARVDSLSPALLKELGVPVSTPGSTRVSCQVSVAKSSQTNTTATTIDWILIQDTKQTSLKALKFAM